MPLVASTGPVLVRCYRIGPVLAHNGMFMSYVYCFNLKFCHYTPYRGITIVVSAICLSFCASLGSAYYVLVCTECSCVCYDTDVLKPELLTDAQVTKIKTLLTLIW